MSENKEVKNDFDLELENAKDEFGEIKYELQQIEEELPKQKIEKKEELNNKSDNSHTVKPYFSYIFGIKAIDEILYEKLKIKITTETGTIIATKLLSTHIQLKDMHYDNYFTTNEYNYTEYKKAIIKLTNEMHKQEEKERDNIKKLKLRLERFKIILKELLTPPKLQKPKLGEITKINTLYENDITYKYDCLTLLHDKAYIEINNSNQQINVKEVNITIEKKLSRKQNKSDRKVVFEMPLSGAENHPYKHLVESTHQMLYFHLHVKEVTFENEFLYMWIQDIIDYELEIICITLDIEYGEKFLIEDAKSQYPLKEWNWIHRGELHWECRKKMQEQCHKRLVELATEYCKKYPQFEFDLEKRTVYGS